MIITTAVKLSAATTVTPTAPSRHAVQGPATLVELSAALEMAAAAPIRAVLLMSAVMGSAVVLLATFVPIVYAVQPQARRKCPCTLPQGGWSCVSMIHTL